MVVENLTVVMSVYRNDSPVFLEQAIDSVFKQTCQAKKLIIVVDGPVNEDIEAVLASLSEVPAIKIIKIAKNKGLATSRKVAISAVDTELVALMDADDICVTDRFERQVAEFSNGDTDVVGGWIEEFREAPGDLGLTRETPLTSTDIYLSGRWRNPINHVTLVFKKSAYDAVGGYNELRGVEDWELISRMLVNGAIIRCIPKICVFVRAGEEMVVRRRETRMFIGEIKVLFLMYKTRYLTLFHLLANILIRLTLRILPIKIHSLTYKYILRKNSITS